MSEHSETNDYLTKRIDDPKLVESLEFLISSIHSLMAGNEHLKKVCNLQKGRVRFLLNKDYKLIRGMLDEYDAIEEAERLKKVES